MYCIKQCALISLINFNSKKIQEKDKYIKDQQLIDTTYITSDKDKNRLSKRVSYKELQNRINGKQHKYIIQSVILLTNQNQET